MKSLAFVTLFAFAIADVEYYTTVDSNIDIDALLADMPKLHSYLDCFLDRAPCTELTAIYKKLIPEVVATACKKCSPIQKHLARQFYAGLKIILPEEYIEFRRKYDPENKYFDYLEKTIAKY